MEMTQDGVQDLSSMEKECFRWAGKHSKEVGADLAVAVDTVAEDTAEVEVDTEAATVAATVVVMEGAKVGKVDTAVDMEEADMEEAKEEAASTEAVEATARVATEVVEACLQETRDIQISLGALPAGGWDLGSRGIEHVTAVRTGGQTVTQSTSQPTS